MPDEKELSVVVPLYNEEESITELCEWIIRVVEEQGYTYEIILVDDGSTDTSWEIVNALATRNENIKGLKFSRNYGKSAALDMGFNYSSGRVVITMDADLQDSPDEIPGLFEMVSKDRFDIVSGWKKKRFDPITKTVPSKFFNYVTSLISGIRLHDFNCGLKAYRSQVVKNIDIYGEMHRYIPVIAKWNGFSKIGEKVVQHRPRKYGVTKFGIERFVFGFLDLLSITFVHRFKKKPMHFFGTLGTLSFFIGLLITIGILGQKMVAIYNNLPMPREVTDQPLFFLSLVALIVGIQLFLVGFLAELITLNSGKKNDYYVEEKLGL